MYANTGYSAYSNEDFSSVDGYSSPGPTSDSDSEQELRDLEELLYSHVHYEPNYLCAAGTVDDLCSSDVHIAHLSDGVLDGLDISAASNGEVSAELVIDAHVRQEEVTETTSSSSSLFPVQQKRKSTRCKTGESDGETRTKSKKVDTKLQSAVGKSPELNSLNNQASSEVIEVGKQEIRQPSRQELAKKEVKPKHKSSSVSRAAATVETGSQIVVDSSSESSSDAYCCDLSSVELSSDDEDDIKLSNINVVLPHMSDVNALADVLNGLSDCNWDVNAQDRATGTPSISRYYSQPASRARCLNCNERGHLARDCTQPKRLLACILCGVRGHMARACPQSLCFNCHRPGHAIRDCDRRRIRYEICRRCGMRGHIQMECPDLWRQYHLTTRPGHIVKSKSEKVKQKFCYNCGACGHFGHECDDDRMDSFSSPTLPFIARYDTLHAARSSSSPHQKKREHSNTDTGEHKKNSSLSRYHQHSQEEKQRDRNVQTVSEKTHLSDSGSCHSLSHLKRKANFSSCSSQRVLASDKRDSKDNRNYSSHHRKDSGLSDRKHNSSKNADNRFRENVNGMLSTSRGHKSEQRRSISADSRSKPNVKQDFDSPVFRENLSNSALKERMEKKLGWINSLPHSTHQQHRREETRDAIKTAVLRKPHISTDAKHKTKVSSAVQDDFRNKAASENDSLPGKNRQVIRTARGFLMTVIDSC